MSCAALHTPIPAEDDEGAIEAFLVWVRAFLAMLLGLAPLDRLRRAAHELLALIAPCLIDPDTGELLSDLDPHDRRQIAFLLDRADGLVSLYIWARARESAGLPKRGRIGRAELRREAPTAASLLTRFLSLRARFAKAELAARRLSRSFESIDLPRSERQPVRAATPSAVVDADASAPVVGDAAPVASLASALRLALLERALDLAESAGVFIPICDFASPGLSERGRRCLSGVSSRPSGAVLSLSKHQRKGRVVA